MLDSLFAGKRNELSKALKKQGAKKKVNPDTPSKAGTPPPKTPGGTTPRGKTPGGKTPGGKTPGGTTTPRVEDDGKTPEQRINEKKRGPQTTPYGHESTFVPESRDIHEVKYKGIRKSYRFDKDATLGSHIQDRLKEEIIEDFRLTKQYKATLTKAQKKALPPDRVLRLERFRKSAKKIDFDPRVDEYTNPKPDPYIYNMGYNQTTVPTLVPEKPPEFTGKTGYYGKQGTYTLPTTTNKDHPVYHDMKKYNPKFSYNNDLVHTNLAKTIVREEENKWRGTKDLRTLSRNFTSLSKKELEEMAKKKIDKRYRYLDFDPDTDLMPEEVNPYDSSMRATVYNPFGKLLGNPTLKTPYRKDRELGIAIEDKPKLITSETAHLYSAGGFPPATGTGRSDHYGATPRLQSSRRSMPNLHSSQNIEELAPPRTFHEVQERKAMYLGEPGQKFTYAALNTEVDNNIVRSIHPPTQPFHMRTARSKIPTSTMNPTFVPPSRMKSGFVTSSYNPGNIKPSTSLQPLIEGMFDKDPYGTPGPLPETALREPTAIYIQHYASTAEECMIRYFMDTFSIEKSVFRYTIPKDVTSIQISPTQIFLCGGIKHGTRNTPSAFCGIFECITGDLVLLPEMNIPRFGHAAEYLNNEIYVIGGTDQSKNATSSVEKFSMISQDWTFITQLKYPRSKLLSCTSHESSSIYVTGGIDKRSKEVIMERYSPHTESWQEIEIVLDFQIIADRTHMCIYNESTKPAPDTRSEAVYDPDDKLIFIHYDNIVYPVPDIYFLSIGQGVIEELKYDKTNSAISTYYKKRVVYDKQLKKIIAFSGSSYTVVDILDVNEEFCFWQPFEFTK
ncbi:unnamed protein product [Moneuplotes crassus]|uniref:Uncharacterized protein n=2 Tax=Euplotes crassus TaxID=5936 RepID=A0AAD1Y7E9_EUPCR|nr:unnamed protein product [Moneuplotes crassus]